MDTFRCEMPTWKEIHELTHITADKIKKSGFHPDVIVSIARGGLVPARLLADYLHVKDLIAIKTDHWGLTATKDGQAKISYALNMDLSGKKVLVVDDITDTGQSMDLSKQHVMERHPSEVRTATLYHLRNSKYTPDFYGMERDWAWMIFPWNVREDKVNIIRKILAMKNLPNGKLREAMKKNFNVSVSSEELEELLDHIKYLDSL